MVWGWTRYAQTHPPLVQYRVCSPHRREGMMKQQGPQASCLPSSSRRAPVLPPWLLRHASTLKGCRHSSLRTYHPPTSKLLPEYIPVAFPPWVGASRNTEVSKPPDFWKGRVKPIHFAACWLDAQSRAVLFVPHNQKCCLILSGNTTGEGGSPAGGGRMCC